MIRAERDEHSRVHNNEIQHTMLSVVTEPLSHSAPREGGEVLERSSLRGRSSNDDSVLHSVVLLECLHELSDSRTLLTNGDVDAVQLLLLVLAIVPPLLVKDSVNGDGSLSGLTVTNDKLTLTTTNGNHGVNGLNTGHHRLVDGTTRQDTRGLKGSTATLSSVDRTLPVNWVSEGVNNTAEQFRTDGYIDDLAGTLDGITLLDETVITEDGHTDVVGFQVETHATDAGRELHHLLGWRELSVRGVYVNG
jgi:hypothetical protein